jgi:hypothetical protein
MYEIHFVFNGDRRPVYVDECRRQPINHLVINGHRSALKKILGKKNIHTHTATNNKNNKKEKKAITFERQLANRISIVGIKKGKLPFEKK